MYVETTVQGACVVLRCTRCTHARCSQEDLRKAEEIMKARKEKAVEDAGKAKAEKEKGATAAVDAERKARQHVKSAYSSSLACTPASAPRTLSA